MTPKVRSGWVMTVAPVIAAGLMLGPWLLFRESGMETPLAGPDPGDAWPAFVSTVRTLVEQSCTRHPGRIALLSDSDFTGPDLIGTIDPSCRWARTTVVTPPSPADLDGTSWIEMTTEAQLHDFPKVVHPITGFTCTLTITIAEARGRLAAAAYEC